MKTIDLLDKLAGTLPGSRNGIFWDEDVLIALKSLSKNDTFSSALYIELMEEFLPKIEMDFKGRAEDYAFDLWKIGDVSKLGESDIGLKAVIDYMGDHNFFYEDDINKNIPEVRELICAYKKRE